MIPFWCDPVYVLFALIYSKRPDFACQRAKKWLFSFLKFWLYYELCLLRFSKMLIVTWLMGPSGDLCTLILEKIRFRRIWRGKNLPCGRSAVRSHLLTFYVLRLYTENWCPEYWPCDIKQYWSIKEKFTYVFSYINYGRKGDWNVWKLELVAKHFFS